MITMTQEKKRPNYRLKRVKPSLKVDEQQGILSIVNVRNGRRIDRRDFFKASGALLVALGMGQMMVGCGEDDDGCNGTWESILKRDYKHMYFSSHGDIVTSVAFNADGTLIVSGSRDYTVKIWDSASQSLIKTLKHNSPVTAVAYSPDGEYIVSGYEGDALILWHFGGATKILEPVYRVYDVAFSPDGSHIVSADRDNVKLWDVATGNLLMAFEHPGCNRVVFSFDGEYVASGGWGAYGISYEIFLWDLDTGKKIDEFITGGGIPGSECSIDIAVNLDKQHILACRFLGKLDFSTAVSNGGICIWDVETDELITTLGCDNAKQSSIAFSTDGRYVAYPAQEGSNHVIRVWEVATGRLVNTIGGTEESIASMVFSSDNRKIAIGSSYYVVVADVESGKCIGACIDFDDAPLATASLTSIAKLKTCGCDRVCSCDSVCECDTVCLQPCEYHCPRYLCPCQFHVPYCPFHCVADV